MVRLTTQDVIDQLVALNGEAHFDYSRVLWRGKSVKVTIGCKACGGWFDMLTRYHKQGKGCPSCELDTFVQTKLIPKFREVHGDNYDYSAMAYMGLNTKVSIICSEHGVFHQKPNKHLKGQGCVRCAGTHRHTTVEFISKAQQAHQFRYTYDVCNYVSAHKKVQITCPTHGVFSQTPSKHLRGAGCPSCANNVRLSYAVILSRIERWHPNKFEVLPFSYENTKSKISLVCRDCTLVASKTLCGWELGCVSCNRKTQSESYSNRKLTEFKVFWGDLFDYTDTKILDSSSRMIVRCRKHDYVFEQDVSLHLLYNGCSLCRGEKISLSKMKTREEALHEMSETHKDSYDYTHFEYLGVTIPSWIGCRTCGGRFKQSLDNHKRGHGCPKCSTGKSERLFGECLKELGYKANKVRPQWLRNHETGYPLELDFYIPELKIAFEVQGLQHYEPVEYFGGVENFKKVQKRDKLKRFLCYMSGVILHEYDLREGRDKESIKNYLNSIL